MQLGKTYTPFNLEWAINRQSVDNLPDPSPRVHHGKEFTKTLPMRCPWCQVVFYVWQAVGHETKPFEDPTPFTVPGMGQRYTCGHPICWGKEQESQMKQSLNYKKSVECFCKPEGKPSLQPTLAKLGT